MSGNEEALNHLIRMANQIAANFAFEADPDVAATAVASNMRRFWSPSMRQSLREQSQLPNADLSDLALRAAAKLQ